MVFDDTHRHFAWNNSSEDRTVLLIDFPRPLPPKLSLLNEQVIDQISQSVLVENAEDNWAEWEKDHGEELDHLLSSNQF